MFPCWKKRLYFYRNKAFNWRVSAICEKEECIIKIRLSPHPLCFEGSDINEEISNTMDGILEDESNGYKCNSFDDGTLRITFFDFMSEGTNVKGNGEEEEERGDNENERRNACIPSKKRFVW